VLGNPCKEKAGSACHERRSRDSFRFPLNVCDAKKLPHLLKKLNAAIANFKKLQAFLDVMSEFLGLVDEVIDLAKTV
jgi:hypothetical protein